MKILIMRTFLQTIFFLAYIAVGSSAGVDESPSFLPSSNNVIVNEGEHAVLPCEVANLGSSTVMWTDTRSDVPLTIGQYTFAADVDISVHHAQLSRSYSIWDLHIKNVRADQAVMYECSIVGNGDRITQRVTLNVLH